MLLEAPEAINASQDQAGRQFREEPKRKGPVSWETQAPVYENPFL